MLNIHVVAYGSKEFAEYLMNRYESSKWESLLDDGKIDAYRALDGGRKNENPAIGCHHNISPKLIYLLHNAKSDNENIQELQDLIWDDLFTEPTVYLCGNCSKGRRYKESDSMNVYPYLDQECKDYFVVYECTLAGNDSEAWLPLLVAQLQSYCSDECFRFDIRAYSADYDKCYSFVEVKNNEALSHQFDQGNGIINQSSWNGMRVAGVKAYDVDFVSQSSVIDQLGSGEFTSDEYSDWGSADLITWGEQNVVRNQGFICSLLNRYKPYNTFMNYVEVDELIEFEFDWSMNTALSDGKEFLVAQ